MDNGIFQIDFDSEKKKKFTRFEIFRRTNERLFCYTKKRKKKNENKNPVTRILRMRNVFYRRRRSRVNINRFYRSETTENRLKNAIIMNNRRFYRRRECPSAEQYDELIEYKRRDRRNRLAARYKK